MLKLRLNGNDCPLLALGLSHMNLSRLKDGYPIKFSLEPFGMKGDLMIFAGETEKAMLDELVEGGMVAPKAAATIARAMEEDR